MVSYIPAEKLPPSPGGTVKFEGGDYGGEISAFLVNNLPGKGPGLHTHPYSETWFVRKGKALMTAGDQSFEAGPGDVIVVSAETPHKFKNIGTERLEIFCVHAAPKMVQVDLEPED
jgi:mannose-6-phosphate isomerase-like protein (cupin superfamily)